MGEIAEMFLDGTQRVIANICECCGEFLNDDAPGYPGYCSKECAKNRGYGDYSDKITPNHAANSFPISENDRKMVDEIIKTAKTLRKQLSKTETILSKKGKRKILSRVDSLVNEVKKRMRENQG